MTRRVLAIIIFLLVPVLGAAQCGTNAVCSDVQGILTGTIVVEGIRVSWSTDSENSDIASYKVARWNGNAWQPVSQHWAIDSACTGMQRTYTATDPSTAAGTYQVSVLNAAQQVLCNHQIFVN